MGFGEGEAASRQHSQDANLKRDMKQDAPPVSIQGLLGMALGEEERTKPPALPG